MDLDILIRGRTWEGALKALDARGITEMTVDEVRRAYQCEMLNTHNDKELISGLTLPTVPDKHWPDHHLEFIKTLMKNGLVEVKCMRYWLTEKGKRFHRALGACYMVRKNTNALAVGYKQSVVDYNSNIDLDRDGLMTTVSKLFWLVRNRDTVRQAKLEQMVEDYQEGQVDIEESLRRIQTSEQRVALELEAAGPPPPPKTDWTEAAQRRQNDLYWMGPGAFWLNPNGPLADPVPAPEWWTPPADYKPKAIIHHTNDIVALSMLEPPSKESVLDEILHELNDDEKDEADLDNVWIGDRYDGKANYQQILIHIQALIEEEFCFYEPDHTDLITDIFSDQLDLEEFEYRINEYFQVDIGLDEIEDLSDLADAIQKALLDLDVKKTGFFIVESKHGVRGFETQAEADEWLRVEQAEAARQLRLKVEADKAAAERRAKELYAKMNSKINYSAMNNKKINTTMINQKFYPDPYKIKKAK